MGLVLVALAGVALTAWVGLALHPARPWDLRPRGDDDRDPGPKRWPSVAICVPARNEADAIPLTLPALAGQDYQGAWSILVVDDRSDDGTADVVRRHGGDRTTVVAGAPLPEGWAGKVWAMAQGVERVGAASSFSSPTRTSCTPRAHCDASSAISSPVSSS